VRPSSPVEFLARRRQPALHAHTRPIHYRPPRS
jgi:hypothetical protein